MSWTNAGNIQGPPGEPGAPGAPGADGIDGTSFWSTTAALNLTVGGTTNLSFANLAGPTGVNPRAGDLVVSTSASSPGALAQVTGISGTTAIVTTRGSIRGESGESGATGPPGPITTLQRYVGATSVTNAGNNAYRTLVPATQATWFTRGTVGGASDVMTLAQDCRVGMTATVSGNQQTMGQIILPQQSGHNQWFYGPHQNWGSGWTISMEFAAAFPAGATLRCGVNYGTAVTSAPLLVLWTFEARPVASASVGL